MKADPKYNLASLLPRPLHYGDQEWPRKQKKQMANLEITVKACSGIAEAVFSKVGSISSFISSASKQDFPLPVKERPH
ncbi:hypothetical protein TNCV_1201361 [Trichonephila clavipes]|nr:hypothetical protein TNCV_1201361 [Trichonephila clavipes]